MNFWSHCDFTLRSAGKLNCFMCHCVLQGTERTSNGKMMEEGVSFKVLGNIWEILVLIIKCNDTWGRGKSDLHDTVLRDQWQSIYYCYYHFSRLNVFDHRLLYLTFLIHNFGLFLSPFCSKLEVTSRKKKKKTLNCGKIIKWKFNNNISRT